MAENTIEFVIRLNGGASAAGDAKKVEAAVAGVGGKMRQVASESEKAAPKVSRFGGSLKHLAVGLGAVGAGYVAWNAAKGAIDYTAELAKNTNSLSKATHMSVGETSSLVAVSGALGVESSKLGMLFSKLGKATIAQAEATGKHVTAFDRLHISQKEAKEDLNNTGAMLDLVTHKLATEHIPAGEKAALMTELFGRGWKSLAPLLLEGETNFKKLTGEAKSFGLELSGSGADGLKKFHDQQIESKLAMDGLRVSFTKLVAGPLGGLLSGFAKLTVYARKGEWSKFNAQVGQMAKAFENLAEKVMPRVAESFAHVAPAILKAFWKGFISAPIGTQAVLALALATKFGLVGSIFKGFGGMMGKSIAGGLLGEQAVTAGVGSKLGGFFGKAFVAAAIGAGIYSFLKNSATERPLEEAWDAISGEEGKLEHNAKTREANERKHFLRSPRAKHQIAGEKKLGSALGQVRSIEAAETRRELAAWHKRHPKMAAGGSIASAGLVEVGEHGPEVVHLPQNAIVDPLKPGSLAPIIENVIMLDGRVLSRSVRRQTLQSQAAGA